MEGFQDQVMIVHVAVSKLIMISFRTVWNLVQESNQPQYYGFYCTLNMVRPINMNTKFNY